MGIDLLQYRVRIGTFRGGSRSPANRTEPPYWKIRSTKLRLLISLSVLACVSFLIIAGDIEQNPGPETEQQRKRTRQTTFSLTTTPQNAPNPNNDDTVMAVLRQVQAQLNSTTTVLEQKLEEINDKLDNTMLKIEKENRELKNKVAVLEDKIDQLESDARKNNLIIHGLAGERFEKPSVTETTAKTFINTNLGIELSGGINTTRLSKWKENGPIKVDFILTKDRESVLTAGKSLKLTNPDGNTYVTEDFTMKVRAARKKLGPFLEKARNDGCKVKMIADRLLIDGTLHTFDNETSDIIPVATNKKKK